MNGFGRRAVLRASAATLAAGMAASSARAQSAPLKLKLGNDLPAAHSVNLRLREVIAAETDGRVAVSLFPNNQLGSDSDMISQLRSGALELATMPGAVLSTLIPATSLPSVGFAFASDDKVWAAMDGEVGSHIRRVVAKANLVPFDAMRDNGFRQITSSTRPIRTPEDLIG